MNEWINSLHIVAQNCHSELLTNGEAWGDGSIALELSATSCLWTLWVDKSMTSLLVCFFFFLNSLCHRWRHSGLFLHFHFMGFQVGSWPREEQTDRHRRWLEKENRLLTRSRWIILFKSHWSCNDLKPIMISSVHSLHSIDTASHHHLFLYLVYSSLVNPANLRRLLLLCGWFFFFSFPFFSLLAWL